MTPELWTPARCVDDLDIQGFVVAELFSVEGDLIDKREVHNLVTTMGKTGIIERLDSSPTATVPSHMELGTGTTAAAVGDVLLQTFIASSRIAMSSNTSAANVLTMVTSWSAGTATNAAITEAGVFSVATANTSSATNPMYSRAVFTAINKGASDTLQITWTYTLS